MRTRRLCQEEKVLAGLKAKLAAMLIGPIHPDGLERAYRDGCADTAIIRGALIYANALIDKATLTVEELKEPDPVLTWYPVSEIGFTNRTLNRLKSKRITHLGQLTLMKREHDFRNASKFRDEIDNAMAERGLKFKDDLP